MTIVISLLITQFFMASKSLTEIDTFVAISDVPAFPGATKR